MQKVEEEINNLTLLEKILVDKTKIPKHIAIIMDGNRRWAKKYNLPSIVGHANGAEKLTKIVEAALNLNIKVLTVFAFSTENWSRSEREINNLMNLFVMYLEKQLDYMIKEGVSLHVIGDLSKCHVIVQNAFNESIKKTQNGKRLKLVIAWNYGARDELKRAFLKLVNDYDEKKISKKEITEKLIEDYLDTKGIKDPDLLIRTSGEQRLSNFMLWQMSYTEIYITNVLWPDFSNDDLYQAILEYQNRKRRLGGA